VAFALLLLAAPGAAAERWQRLGSAVVNDRLDHDSIAVTASRGDFSAIKLKVERAPVHFLSVKIHFANGESQDVEVRSVIPAGGETRTIDVVGADRVIRRVEFWYEAQTVRRGKRATVRLFARG
jgi:hypothetical protein